MFRKFGMAQITAFVGIFLAALVACSGQPPADTCSSNGVAGASGTDPCASTGGSGGLASTGGGTSTSDPAPTGPVTLTITPAGATLRVVTAEHVEITFVFPPGAVAAPLDVTVAPLPAATGAWSSLQLSPAGTSFAKPIAVTVTLPSNLAATTNGAIYFGNPDTALLLATQITVSSNRLTADLSGFPSDPAALAAISLAMSLTGSSTSGSAAPAAPASPAASGARLASVSAASAAAPASAPTDPTPAPTDPTPAPTDPTPAPTDPAPAPPALNAGELTPSQLTQSAGQAYANFESAPGAGSANTLSSAIGAIMLYMQQQPDPPAELTAWLGTNESRTCTGLEAACVTVDATASVPGLPSFKTIVMPMFNWLEVDNAIGSNCPTDHVFSALQAKADLLVDLWDIRIVASHTLTELRNLFSDTMELTALAQKTGVDATLVPRIRDLQQRLMTPWRAAAVAQCHSGSGGIADLGLMKLLIEAGFDASFSSADVASDGRLCGIQLTFEVISPLDNSLQTTATLGGSTSNVSDSVRLPMTGKIKFNGSVQRLECPTLANPDAQVLGMEQLAFFMYDDSGNVHDLNRKFGVDKLPWQFNNEEFNLAGLLTQGMGYTSSDQVLHGKLVLQRLPGSSGPNCGQVFNDDGTEITLNVEWDPVPKLLTVTANPAAITLPTSNAQTFTLGFEALGSSIVKLKQDVVMGARTVAIDWKAYTGMTGHSGSGTYDSAIGLCSDKPVTTKIDTFQIRDDLDQDSETKSFNSAMTYGSACCVPMACAALGVPCSSPNGCVACMVFPDGCGGTLDCTAIAGCIP